MFWLAPALLLLLGLAPLPAQSAGYVFVNLTPPQQIVLTAFSGAPALNDAGKAAFLAKDALGVAGVYLYSVGDVYLVASANGVFESFGHDPVDPALPSIDAAGNVGFWARLDSGEQGFYRGNAASITPIAETPGALGGFDSLGNPDAWLDDAGSLTFWAVAAGGAQGIYRGDGGTPTLLYLAAPSGAEFSELGADPALSSGGDVAFLALSPTLGAGLFTGPGAPIAASFVSAYGACTAPPPIAINASGLLAHPSLGPSCFSQALLGGVVLADAASSAYSRFDVVALNDNGVAAYLAQRDVGGEALLRSDDPGGVILQTGDALFGSTVTDIDFGRQGFDDARRVAIRYTLADGREGIARGTPTRCDNDIDDDGDGLVDYGIGPGNDPGCSSAADTTETSTVQCDNGVDDDGDTKKDWRPDGSGDPDCTSVADTSEFASPPPPACGIGPELLALALLAAARRRGR